MGNIREALAARLFPSVTTWNRIEGRPRPVSFDRALQAEVRDALWMLTKQWQMGAFQGSDAGSPVFARLDIETTRFTKYRPDDGATQAFEYNVALVAKVERRPVPMLAGGRALSVDLRLAMGRQWLKLIGGIGNFRRAFLNAYPITAPDPANHDDADRCAHPEVWQLFAAVAGRAMDGGALYAYLVADPAHRASDGVIGIGAGPEQAAVDLRGASFFAWFERLLLQPAQGDDAWVASRLECQFAASAPLPSPPGQPPASAEKVYVANDYSHGRLDWYSVDVDRSVTALGSVAGSTVTGLAHDGPRTVIPVPVSFAGMPNSRWWAFEDQKTNFGDVDASTTDLASLLFLEFALVYANDWFVIPYTLAAGAVATVRGFVVDNVFGERFWLTPAESGPDNAWQRWSMFTVNARGQVGAADTSLVLMPTVSKVQEVPPTEDVWLMRDEVANMVWGVERTVPLASGDSKPGHEAERQTLAFYQAQLAASRGGLPPPPRLPTPRPAIR